MLQFLRPVFLVMANVWTRQSIYPDGSYKQSIVLNMWIATLHEFESISGTLKTPSSADLAKIVDIQNGKHFMGSRLIMGVTFKD